MRISSSSNNDARLNHIVVIVARDVSGRFKAYRLAMCVVVLVSCGLNGLYQKNAPGRSSRLGYLQWDG